MANRPTVQGRVDGSAKEFRAEIRVDGRSKRLSRTRKRLEAEAATRGLRLTQDTLQQLFWMVVESDGVEVGSLPASSRKSAPPSSDVSISLPTTVRQTFSARPNRTTSNVLAATDLQLRSTSARSNAGSLKSIPSVVGEARSLNISSRPRGQALSRLASDASDAVSEAAPTYTAKKYRYQVKKGSPARSPEF